MKTRQCIFTITIMIFCMMVQMNLAEQSYGGAMNANDDESLKEMSKRLKDKNPIRQFEAIETAKSVGGPDMIRGLAELLNDTNEYISVNFVGQFHGSNAQGDIVFEPPRYLAAKALSEIVENPPVPPVGENKKYYTEEDVVIWQAWWAENKQKFEFAQ